MSLGGVDSSGSAQITPTLKPQTVPNAPPPTNTPQNAPRANQTPFMSYSNHIWKAFLDWCYTEKIQDPTKFQVLEIKRTQRATFGGSWQANTWGILNGKRIRLDQWNIETNQEALERFAYRTKTTPKVAGTFKDGFILEK